MKSVAYGLNIHSTVEIQNWFVRDQHFHEHFTYNHSQRYVASVKRSPETHIHIILLTWHFSYAVVDGCMVLALVGAMQTSDSRIA